MQKNVQSIAPSFTPVTSPQIDDPEPQGTLPTGPTGVVHRGGGGAPAPWHKRLALTKAPTPAAHHVLLVLGAFVLDDASDAWPSKATLASMTGRSPRVVQRALRELKSAGLISVRQSSGRTPHYRLSVAPPETPTSPQGRRPRLPKYVPVKLYKIRKQQQLPTTRLRRYCSPPSNPRRCCHLSLVDLTNKTHKPNSLAATPASHARTPGPLATG